MPARTRLLELDRSASPFKRAFRYAFYDWTLEMPKWKRIVTSVGLVIQGYSVWCLWTRSLIWPVMWPNGPAVFAIAWLINLSAYCLINGMLTSEFIRKRHLESDQLAAQQIQRTLHPEKLDILAGYQMATLYQPYRAVGGDYFDVIELPGNRTLFAVADVSGKGMAAALLAANIQALVRSLSSVDVDPLALARQMNRHLSRYTPADRFATAVFLLLSRESGEVTYVNAGHNAPVVFGPGPPVWLEATGVPLGLFSGADYAARTVALDPGGTLVLYTDGLTDSIAGDSPQERLPDALAGTPKQTLANLKRLIDPKLVEDDVTVLVVKRD